MALGTPSLQVTVTAATTSATTGSFAPTSGHRLYAIVGCWQNTTGPGKPSVSDSQSLTWSEVADASYDAGSNPRTRLTVYTAIADGSAMTVSATGGGSGGTSIAVVSYPDAGEPSANWAFGTSNTGDPSVTISAVASGSGVLGVYMANGGNQITPPTGYAELYDATLGNRWEIVWDNTSPATTLTWSTGNVNTIGLALEIPEASSGYTGTMAGTLPGLTGAVTADHGVSGALAGAVGLVGAISGAHGHGARRIAARPPAKCSAACMGSIRWGRCAGPARRARTRSGSSPAMGAWSPWWSA